MRWYRHLFHVGRGCKVGRPLCVVGSKKEDRNATSGWRYASAGNRTRVTSMATMYSATRPLMPMISPIWSHPSRGQGFGRGKECVEREPRPSLQSRRTMQARTQTRTKKNTPKKCFQQPVPPVPSTLQTKPFVILERHQVIQNWAPSPWNSALKRQ